MIKNKPRINENDFYKNINQAIAAGQHVEALKEIVAEFEDYKKVFEENFAVDNPEDAVYRFRLTYVLKENVWREFEVVGRQTLDKLSDAIVKSMKWKIDHLHGFSLQDPNPEFPGQASPYTIFPKYSDDDQYPTFKSNEIRICDIDYKKQPKLEYVFDFGDGHRFDMDFILTREITEYEKIKDFPCLVDQRGVAPKQYLRY